MQQNGQKCQQGRKYNNMVENVIKVENTTTWSKMSLRLKMQHYGRKCHPG